MSVTKASVTKEIRQENLTPSVPPFNITQNDRTDTDRSVTYRLPINVL